MTERKLAVQIYPDARSLAEAGTVIFSKLSRDSVAEKGIFRVALSGGSTPQYLYQALLNPANCEPIAWDQTHFFWGDERNVLARPPK